MNKFVFLVPASVLLFEQLATVDFRKYDIKLFFCFVVTATSIIDINFDSPLWKD